MANKYHDASIRVNSGGGFSISSIQPSI